MSDQYIANKKEIFDPKELECCIEIGGYKLENPPQELIEKLTGKTILEGEKIIMKGGESYDGILLRQYDGWRWLGDADFWLGIFRIDACPYGARHRRAREIHCKKLTIPDGRSCFLFDRKLFFGHNPIRNQRRKRLFLVAFL